MIKASGETPEIIEYIKALPSRDEIKSIAKAAGLPIRALLRSREVEFDTLKLGEEGLDDDCLLDAIENHPALLNRPIVVTSKGAALARPIESVLPILERQIPKRWEID